MIEFLQDYTTEALPPEKFAKGAQVTRSEESERYFVGRGLAGYVVDGKLVDIDHLPLTPQTITVEVVQPGERRADLAVRAGEIMTGQPPRATSGPGVPFVEPEAGIAGSPAVVMEAEIERLKGLLATGDDLFREMNNSHVDTHDTLRGDVDRLTGELAGVRSELDQAKSAAAAAQERHEAHVRDANERHEADANRIADLERQLSSAKTPHGDTPARPVKAK
jgi:hypothetical protein